MSDLCNSALVSFPLVSASRQGTMNLPVPAVKLGVDYKRIVYILNFWAPTTSPQWGAFGDN